MDATHADSGGRLDVAEHARPQRRVVVYTDSTLRGGAESSLRNLLVGLHPRIDVAVLGVDARITEWIASARPAAEWHVLKPIRSKWDFVRMFRHRRAIDRLRPDVLHANLTSLWSCQYGLIAALSIPGLRVMAVEHSPLASPSALSRWLKRMTSKRLAAHVGVGNEVSRQIEKLVGLPRQSMVTIYNGVPVPRSAPQRVAPSPVVGTVARLEHFKGVDLLVEAFAGLREGQLVIVGEGEQRPEIERMVVQLGLRQRVHLVGWREDTAELIAGFDVFALPSRLESMPLTVIEAMLAGVPVVATDVGSMEEAVLHGVTGLLVPVDDTAQLQGALRTLLDDAALRRDMGAAGRLRAETMFTVATMATRYELLYDALIAAPGGARHRSLSPPA